MALITPKSGQTYSNVGATVKFQQTSYTNEKQVDIVSPDYSNRFDDYDYYWGESAGRTAFSNGFSNGFK